MQAAHGLDFHSQEASHGVLACPAGLQAFNCQFNMQEHARSFGGIKYAAPAEDQYFTREPIQSKHLTHKLGLQVRQVHLPASELFPLLPGRASALAW